MAMWYALVQAYFVTDDRGLFLKRLCRGREGRWVLFSPRLGKVGLADVAR